MRESVAGGGEQDAAGGSGSFGGFVFGIGGQSCRE